MPEYKETERREYAGAQWSDISIASIPGKRDGITKESADFAWGVDGTGGVMCDGSGAMKNAVAAGEKVSTDTFYFLTMAQKSPWKTMDGAVSDTRTQFAKMDKALVMSGDKRTTTWAFLYKFNQQTALFGWAGDTRISLFRAGKLFTLTLDHTYFNEVIVQTDHGNRDRAWKIQRLIDEQASDEQILSELQNEEERKFFYERHRIAKFLGGRLPSTPFFDFSKAHTPELRTLELQPNDRFLFTTDGVHSWIRRSDLESWMSMYKTSKRATGQIIGQLDSLHQLYPKSDYDDAKVMIIGDVQ